MSFVDLSATRGLQRRTGALEDHRHTEYLTDSTKGVVLKGFSDDPLDGTGCEAPLIVRETWWPPVGTPHLRVDGRRPVFLVLKTRWYERVMVISA